MSHSTCYRAPARGVLTDRIYRALATQGVDCAPLNTLARVLRAGPGELWLAADSVPHLGVCFGGGGQPFVYCLPPEPVAAGFSVGHRDGHLCLYLRPRWPRPPLWIRGEHVGPVPPEERPFTLGGGELAYTICRLTLMARDWLPATANPTRYLFELVAEAWRQGSRGARDLRGAQFQHPIAFGPLVPGGSSNRLELVTRRVPGGRQLINAYPVPGR